MGNPWTVGQKKDPGPELVGPESLISHLLSTYERWKEWLVHIFCGKLEFRLESQVVSKMLAKPNSGNKEEARPGLS